MDTEVDVLIIGAGPAGLAAGIVCGQHGLRTIVCEKRQLPADKACGEGVMPTGVSYLERLGIKRYLTEGRYFPLDGIRYLSPNGKTASAIFREGPGLGTPRLELSKAMLKRASEVDCLEIRTEVQVTSIEFNENKNHRLISARVGKNSIGARLLVGADGLNSSVRRWAGLEGSKGRYQRWGARTHFDIKPWRPEVEIHWGNGMEAYVTPCGENLVGVAFLWDRSRHPRLPGGDRLMPALLEAFPALRKRLKDAPIRDHPLAVGPMQRQSLAPIADGVLLIGDAAGYLDALTGEGISLALAQCLALERTVLPKLLKAPNKESLPRPKLADYERAYHDIMRPYYQVTRLVLWLSRYPALAEQVIGLLGRNPVLFSSVLSANMGNIPLWKAVLGRQE